MDQQLQWENIEIIETDQIASDGRNPPTPKIYINKVEEEFNVEFRGSDSQLLTPTLNKRGNYNISTSMGA